MLPLIDDEEAQRLYVAQFADRYPRGDELKALMQEHDVWWTNLQCIWSARFRLKEQQSNLYRTEVDIAITWVDVVQAWEATITTRWGMLSGFYSTTPYEAFVSVLGSYWSVLHVEWTKMVKVIRQMADTEDGASFLGWPDRWFDDRHVRCIFDHVSTLSLKSEALGADVCLVCYQPVHLTFPEDKDGEPLNWSPYTKAKA